MSLILPKRDLVLIDPVQLYYHTGLDRRILAQAIGVKDSTFDAYLWKVRHANPQVRRATAEVALRWEQEERIPKGTWEKLAYLPE